MLGMEIRKALILSACRCALAAMLLALPAGYAAAQDADAIAASQAARQAEYESVSREITLSEERLASLAAEVASIRKDHATITAELIQAAKTEKKLSQEIEDITGRLEGLREQEESIRQSLAARRGVLAEVLGALQRMGLNPPPAILVKPEDALSSVRSAILLGAVVPELRSETEILMADMKEMARVTGSIEAERGRLEKSVGEQLAEKERLNLLLEEKQQLQGQTEAAVIEERERSAELAARAGSLKELIATLEKQAEKTRKAEAAAKLAEEKRLAREAERSAPPEGNRLVASAPFSALRGQVALPVTGRIERRYGAKDDNGGVALGDMVATQSGAIVTAPANGSVLYAGPFRSYGQLLILNAGGGYHIVLAGMSKISVSPGQSVLAGEPVGAMGEARVASVASSGNGKTGADLYVEFRKDGKPVDPAPWWAERRSGRTGNGT